jgi:hypothetical protein
MFLFINIVKKNLLLSLFVFVAIVITIVLVVSGSIKKELLLVKTVPPSNTPLLTLDSHVPIFFYFSDKIDKKTVDVSVSPNIKIITDVQSDGENNVLKIIPSSAWEYNTQYSLTIKESLSSQDGKKLTGDVVFLFLIDFPKAEDMPPLVGPGSQSKE